MRQTIEMGKSGTWCIGLLHLAIFYFRYEKFLTKAKNVGYKKGILTALVTGLLFFVIFSGYALGFW